MPSFSYPFDTLPIVRRTRELYRLTGGSLTCGWMYDEVAFLLYSLIKWYRPDLVIQTGHLWGKSASIVLEALNDGFITESGIEEQQQRADERFSTFVIANSSKRELSGRLISIDPNPLYVPNWEQGVSYLCQLHDNFKFYRMKSSDFFAIHGARLLSEYHAKRIVGIVDGDHSWSGCLSDLENLASLGAEVIFVDDTSWLPRLLSVVRCFAHRNRYDFINLPLYNGVGLLFRQGSELPNDLADNSSPFPLLYAIGYRIGGMNLLRIMAGSGLGTLIESGLRRSLDVLLGHRGTVLARKIRNMLGNSRRS